MATRTKTPGERNTWVEYRNRPSDELGEVLRGLTKTKDGKANHRLMKEVVAGDRIVHLVKVREAQSIAGTSIVQGPPKVQKIRGREQYVIRCKNFSDLDKNSISLDGFKRKYEEQIRRDIERLNEAQLPNFYPFDVKNDNRIVLHMGYFSKASPTLADLFSKEILRSYARSDRDALDDIGVDHALQFEILMSKYNRDLVVREAVIKRAHGKCELCGETGFACLDGERYLEAHHIISLSEDGPDRLSNVIALCPKHHREAHFGERCVELEKEMLQIVERITSV